jgi:hypothetical protein
LPVPVPMPTPDARDWHLCIYTRRIIGL